MIGVPTDLEVIGRPEGRKRRAADGGLAISKSWAAMAGSSKQQAGLDRQPGQNRGVWHEQPRATSSSMRRPET